MGDQTRPAGSREAVGPPTALQVEITSFCNLTCKMCPLTLGATLSSIRSEHMQDAAWSEVVQAARRIGRVNMTGFGENTTNPRFLDLIRELDDLGVRTSFTTNAIRMTREVVAGLATLRLLDHINVSIDSPDPEVYREIRGGKLSKALEGLANLASGLPPRVTITASSVVMESNVETLLDFPEILSGLGVRHYILQGMHDRTETLADDDICRNPRGAETIAEIRRRCLERGIAVELVAESRIELEGADPEAARRIYYRDGGAFSPERTRQCESPWTYPFIDRTGRVFPCCHGDETSVMGQLGVQTFDQIWHGEPFRTFRDDLVGGTDLPSICGKCVNVRLGPHPLRYGAEVDREASSLSGHEGLRLVVKNTGAAAWTSAAPLLLGTIGNAACELALPAWITPMRIAAMNEAVVPPGGWATFDFDLRRAGVGVYETFGLLFEGTCWLPEVAIELPDPATRSAVGPTSTTGGGEPAGPGASPTATIRFDRPGTLLRPFARRARGVARRLVGALGRVR